MAYKNGGKKAPMNPASSMSNKAAMYASKTSMYGKPMMNGGPGDDEKKKKEAQRAASESAARANAFRKSMYSSEFGKLSKDAAKTQAKQDYYYGDNSDKGESLKSLYSSKQYSEFAKSQGGDSKELRNKVAGEFAFARGLSKKQYASSPEAKDYRLREGVAIAESLGRKRKN